MKKINLEEILFRHLINLNTSKKFSNEEIEEIKLLPGFREFINAMKEACQEILKLAVENAKVESIIDDTGKTKEISESIYKPHPNDSRLDEFIHVNKESILNTINQIE